jgi:hypothetical protein
MEDWRGRIDRRGRELKAPAILVSGVGRYVTVEDGPGVAPLLRGPDTDLFR